MKCVICKKGETKTGKVTVTLDRAGATFVVRNVPAQVCQNCGEEYVDAKTTAYLLKTAEKTARKGTVVDVCEYMVA